MGHSPKAIRKGTAAEYLAKAWFSKQGYSILVPDTHETPFDFLAMSGSEVVKVQVKATTTVGDLIRIRNKHGGNNAAYEPTDYDILAGVWVDRSRIYLFRSDVINSGEYGEALTVDTVISRDLSNHKRPKPYYEGSI